jgi:hypothetical protein
MGAWSTLFGVADSSRNRRNQVEVAAAAVAAIVESEQIPRWGGSVPGHIVHYRDRKGAFTKSCVEGTLTTYPSLMIEYFDAGDSFLLQILLVPSRANGQVLVTTKSLPSFTSTLLLSI